MKPDNLPNEIGIGRHYPPINPSLMSKISSYIVVSMITVPVIATFMNILNRTRVIGRNNIADLRPPWILASNHLTLLDDLFLDPVILFPKIITGYKYIPYHAPEERNFYKKRLVAWFMRKAKSIPIVRGKGIFQLGMDRIIEAVKNEGILHIFPEGTRTRTGDIGEGKPGVGRIVLETGAPVVPVYHQGIENVLPIGTGVPRMFKEIRIAIGKPIRFDQEVSPGEEIHAWKDISRSIIEAIQEQKSVVNEKWGFKPVRTTESSSLKR